MSTSAGQPGDVPPPASRPTAGTTIAAAAPAVPPRVVVELTSSRWQRFSSRVAWIGFLLCAFMLIGQSARHSEYYDRTKGIEERFHSGAPYAQDKIAIIDVSGVIMEGDGFVKTQIDRIREDENVRAVVVRVDSPGGTVTGSDYILHHLEQLKKDKGIPLVVSMGALAASGGYYVSMAVGDQERSIFAEPTTTTGSIGVVIPHYDFSGLLERFDVKDDSIASHPHKLMLSLTRPMSPDERELAQQYVNESFERFKMIVKRGRPAFREQEGLMHGDRDLATGELFSAARAKEYGLIDEIGFLEDALARAAELAGKELEKVRVVEYLQPGLSLDQLLGFGRADAAVATRSSELSALLELSVPRAYYLCTTLPALIRHQH